MKTWACEHCGAQSETMSVRAASAALNVGDRRVRDLIEAGQLPGAYLFDPFGKGDPHWRIPVDAVIARLEARRAR